MISNIAPIAVSLPVSEEMSMSVHDPVDVSDLSTAFVKNTASLSKYPTSQTSTFDVEPT